MIPPQPPEGLRFDGPAIVYHTRLSPLLRPLAVFFAIVPSAAFVGYYVVMARGLDWANPPAGWEIALTTLGFLILPLVFGAFLLTIAAFGENQHLRLDPATGTAELLRWSPLHRRRTVLPLAEVRLGRIVLLAHDPANENPAITLWLGPRDKITLAGFLRDDEARDWARRIEAVIG